MTVKSVSWQRYLCLGGYPALVTEDMTEDDKYAWLQAYAHTYLVRDVRGLVSFRDLELFLNFYYPKGWRI